MTRIALPLILLTVLTVHLVMAEPTEPFWNGDETRHVMTGIFVADALADGGWKSPRQYATDYYAKYPALGLIVWPPGFYAVEGSAMLVFGRTFETARWLTVAYCLLACIYLFRLACLTHGEWAAAIATLIFAFSREVVFFSRNVMLEVPATAFVLMAMLYLEKYLQSQRRRDLNLCSLGCILAGLHRYDAVLLILYFAVRLSFARQWRLALKKEVILNAALVMLVLAPFFGLAVWEIGGVQAQAASSGSDPTSAKLHPLDQYSYYLRTLWAQIGQTACLAAVIGLLLSFRRANRSRSAPYWSLILAVFLFFAPLAEQETRHVVYWIAAWSVFAADAVLTVGRRIGNSVITTLLALLVVSGSAFWTLKQPVPWVRGYSVAAELVLKTIDGPGVVLFDGHMSGTMICELRTHDPDRRLWLVRADKVFYSSLSDPNHGYVEWTPTDAEILKRLQDISPDLIVLEEPRARTDTPMSKKLRELLKARSDLYVQAAILPVANNNLDWLDGVKLIVYRPTQPRPPGERRIVIPMLWQGRQLETVIPER